MNSILLFMLLFTAAEVQSVCYSTSSYYATTALKSVQYYQYSNNDDCVMHIIPNALYRSGYYLELKWTKFDIEGSLPTCEDYVEVFLTSQRKSIGKYCSGNLASDMLFNMYSSDGYATIRFRSDHSTTKGGFRFTFQLKSIRSGYIGTYGSGLCYQAHTIEDARKISWDLSIQSFIDHVYRFLMDHFIFSRQSNAFRSSSAGASYESFIISRKSQFYRYSYSSRDFQRH